MGAMTTEEAYLYENIAKQVMPLREEVAQLRVMITELKATESRAPSGQTEFAGCMAKDLRERVCNGDYFTHERTGKRYALFTDVLGTRLEEK